MSIKFQSDLVTDSYGQRPKRSLSYNVQKFSRCNICHELSLRLARCGVSVVLCTYQIHRVNTRGPALNGTEYSRHG